MFFYEPQYREYELGTELDFSDIRYNIVNYFEYGISEPERGFSWICEKEAMLSFTFTDDVQIIQGHFNLADVFCGKQNVIIFANDVPVFSEIVTGCSTLSFVFSKPKNGKVILKFLFPDASSPFELGKSEDKRVLSLCIKNLVFTKLEPKIIPNNSVISFLKKEQNFKDYIICGLSEVQDNGTWTDKKILSFAIKFKEEELLLFNAKLVALFNEKQNVQIFANGISVFKNNVTNLNDINCVFLPSSSKEVLFNVILNDANSPKNLGLSDDERLLGLMLENISFKKVNFKEYEIGTTLFAKKNNPSLVPYIIKGFSFQEKDFTWTDGKILLFCAKLKNYKIGTKLSCRIFLKGVFNGSQEVSISVFDNQVFLGNVDNSITEIDFNIDKLNGNEVVLEFSIPNAFSPNSLDSNDNDKRELSLKIEKMIIDFSS